MTDKELADRIESMAALGVLSELDGSGQLDLNGRLGDEEKAQIVAALRRSGDEITCATCKARAS